MDERRLVRKLTIGRWLFLFATTLGFGGLIVVLMEMLFNLHGIMSIELTVTELIFALLWLFAMGMTFGTISQMAFFAYLMLHRLGLGLFKSVNLWRNVQIVFIIVTYFDLVYFRYVFYQQPGETWLNYLLLPSLLFLVSLPVAYLKAKQTRAEAFVPALFLLFVITSIASIPALALTENSTAWVSMMVVTIFACHTWQILMLHRLNQPASEEK